MDRLEPETRNRLGRSEDFAQLLKLVQERHKLYRDRLETPKLTIEETESVRGRIKELKEIMSLVIDDYKLSEPQE